MADQPRSRARARSGAGAREARVGGHQKLLDFTEIERLRAWGVAQTAQGARGGALVVALLGTAGRCFEVAALSCRDIHLGPGGPEVYFPETKGGEPATVPISDDTYQALSRWSNGRALTAPLIPTEQGTFMHRATLWRAFKSAVHEAGITRQVGVHAARHAAGLLLLRATGDLTKVQTFLRHKSIGTTDTWYKHVHLPDLRAGLAKAQL